MLLGKNRAAWAGRGSQAGGRSSQLDTSQAAPVAGAGAAPPGGKLPPTPQRWPLRCHWCRRALELVAEMRSRGIDANIHTYSALMSVCVKCK